MEEEQNLIFHFIKIENQIEIQALKLALNASNRDLEEIINPT